jgi:hypothetical protein
VSEIDVEDTIFYDKLFYSITRIGDTVVFTPDFSANSTPDSINMVRSYMRFLPVHHGGDVCVKGRYLVESRGELLKVVRYSAMLSDDTSSFAVFRMSPSPIVTSAPYYAWERLDHLDGRMVFVGRGNSRSLESADFKQCRSGVYFHDDVVFNMPAMVAYGYHGRKFPCFDNGFWPGHGEAVKKWYDWRLPSSYTSPTWYLH